MYPAAAVGWGVGQSLSTDDGLMLNGRAKHVCSLLARSLLRCCPMPYWGLRVTSKALERESLSNELASSNAVHDMASLPFDSIDWFSVLWIIDKETSHACAFWGLSAVDGWPVAHPGP
jgi:hypothetical protein